MKRFPRKIWFLAFLILLNLVGYSWARCYFQSRPQSLTEEYNERIQSVNASASIGYKYLELGLEFVKLLAKQR